MIGYLRGQVIYKHSNMLIIDVAGVGYELSVPVSVLETVSEGAETALFIHHNVRDDGHYLFGFATLAQRQLFREVTRVSGIGPKTGLLILSGFSVEKLVQVIGEENSTELVRLPGIGKKTAERLIIELKDRVGKLFIDGVETTTGDVQTSNQRAAQETEEALIALGYRAGEAAKLVDKILKDYDDNPHSDVLLKRVLQYKFQGGR